MRRTSQRARGGPRRKLVWARNTQSTTLPAAVGTPTPAFFDLLSNFEAQLGAQLVGATVMRIRGVMQIGLGTAYPAAGITSVKATVEVTEQSKLLIGAAAQDSAYTASVNNDYMLYEPFLIGGANPGFVLGTDVQGRMIDVKSMRRITDLDQALVLKLSTQNTVATGGTSSFFWDLSVLVALS